MKTLHFDIDGTLLTESEPKTALAGGAFERAVRETGLSRLVCVGNIVTTIRFLFDRREPIDGLRMVFDTCRGTFADWEWFRLVTSLVEDSEHRARHIELSNNWFYLDDLAEAFFTREGMADLYGREVGKRILAPDPFGDGSDVLRWLSQIGAQIKP